MPPKKSSGLPGSLTIVESRRDESQWGGQPLLEHPSQTFLCDVAGAEDSARRKTRAGERTAQRCKPMILVKGTSTTDE